MRSMVEGARGKRLASSRAPSVSAARCHLPVPGRICKIGSARTLPRLGRQADGVFGFAARGLAGAFATAGAFAAGGFLAAAGFFAATGFFGAAGFLAGVGGVSADGASGALGASGAFSPVSFAVIFSAARAAIRLASEDAVLAKSSIPEAFGASAAAGAGAAAGEPGAERDDKPARSAGSADAVREERGAGSLGRRLGNGLSEWGG